MNKLSTIEIKEAISITFDKPFTDLISRRFAENNYAKYLFVKECKKKGMSISVIARHLNIKPPGVFRYIKEYVPDAYIQELYEPRFESELKKLVKIE